MPGDRLLVDRSAIVGLRGLLGGATLAFAAWFAPASQAAADLSGSYGIEIACSDALLEGSRGEAYVRHCFLGDRYRADAGMELVQNGNAVCGSYSECLGANCSQVDAGRVVGRLAGDTLTLFAETGNQQSGPVEARVFTVVPDGLADSRGKVRYWRRASGLADPSVARACDPRFPAKVELDAYMLNVPGIAATQQLKFLRQATGARMAAPPPQRFELAKPTTTREWQDSRAPGNHVPRLVHVRNGSTKTWNVAVNLPQACRAFLEANTSARGRASLAADVSSGGSGSWIGPGRAIDFLSCKGSSWTFEDKPACPSMTCLENCKC